ncbi:MAG: hypothetical protein AB1657_05375 [Candidatus Micrarchaeota archaeon]
MKELFPSFADPKAWRCNRRDYTTKETWRRIRQKILARDDYACQYCGFRAMHWQIVHHIDGNPNNNSLHNLEVLCPMCNLVMHAGQGCIIQEVVDLYRQSKFAQGRVNAITRKMRSEGKADAAIIAFLGLRANVPFRMDKRYLKSLFGFVSSRKPAQEWARNALEYGYHKCKSEMRQLGRENRRLSEFMCME